jgi:outer membrane receptor protein involved in Fe transport
VRNEQFFYPDGSLQQTRVQDFHRNHYKYIITTNLDYEFGNGDQLRINGFVQPFTIREVDTTPFTAFNNDGTVNRTAIDDRVAVANDRLSWEVAAEYEKAALGGDFNLITIIKRASNPRARTRNEIENGVIREISRNVEQEDEDESIARGTYTRDLSSSMSLELGVEGAVNIIDVDNQVFFDADNDGLVELFPFPTSHSRVKELRGELFATHNWTITDDLIMESSLNAEYSKVSNNFDFVPSKDYYFLKPRIDLRYSFNELNQLGIKIGRTVTQLNLEDFIPSFDFTDNEIDAGNLGLAPQTAWEYEARWESRLPNDSGVIELRLFYDDIQDYLGKTIISFNNNDPLNGDPISATGSRGNASQYGGELKSSLRLGWMGLPEVVVDGRYLLRNSEVTVPFSNEKLEFDTEWELDLGMRHDITQWSMSYGITYKNSGPSVPSRDLNFSANLSNDAHVEVFAEKELFAGITARFEANGLLPSNESRDRILYSVSNTNGVITQNVRRTEFYHEKRDRRFVFSLRGTY